MALYFKEKRKKKRKKKSKLCYKEKTKHNKENKTKQNKFIFASFPLKKIKIKKKVVNCFKILFLFSFFL